jgi:hypothetical protein
MPGTWRRRLKVNLNRIAKMILLALHNSPVQCTPAKLVPGSQQCRDQFPKLRFEIVHQGIGIPRELFRQGEENQG